MLVRFFRALKKSPWLAIKVTADRVVDFFKERKLGIRTSGLIPIETLMDDWAGNHDYAPTSIRAFQAFMESLDIRREDEEVFIDYGSGLGRVLLLASEYPFKRITGVEVTEVLAEKAAANIKNYKKPRQCEDIQIWVGSASDFEIPDDASLIYLNNPFHGQVLTDVFKRLEKSLSEKPRRLRVVYNNPTHFMKIFADYPWLEIQRKFSFEQECIIFRAIPDKILDKNRLTAGA
jgi:SAM-dependent methyltransferase